MLWGKGGAQSQSEKSNRLLVSRLSRRSHLDAQSPPFFACHRLCCQARLHQALRRVHTETCSSALVWCTKTLVAARLIYQQVLSPAVQFLACPQHCMGSTSDLPSTLIQAIQCALTMITYRTFTGFGESTNKSVLVYLGDLRRFCKDPSDYLFRLLGPPKLLQLPNELLLQIAHFLDWVGRNQDLRHLALTCRRLRLIAHEALICNAVLTPASVRDYLEIVLQHPEYVAKMSGTLHLHATRAHHQSRDTAISRQHWSFTNNLIHEHCHSLMEDTCGIYGLEAWTRELSEINYSR
jgi:hypothetical protein